MNGGYGEFFVRQSERDTRAPRLRNALKRYHKRVSGKYPEIRRTVKKADRPESGDPMGLVILFLLGPPIIAVITAVMGPLALILLLSGALCAGICTKIKMRRVRKRIENYQDRNELKNEVF